MRHFEGKVQRFSRNQLNFTMAQHASRIPTVKLLLMEQLRWKAGLVEAPWLILCLKNCWKEIAKFRFHESRIFIRLSHTIFYATRFPVLCMYILQALCGFLFTIKNHNQTRPTSSNTTESRRPWLSACLLSRRAPWVHVMVVRRFSWKTLTLRGLIE